MNIVLLEGAYKNAGDFLIAKRCEELIKYCYPDCHITSYKRNIPLDSKLSEVNEADCIFLGGGPAYGMNMYPDLIRLVENIDNIVPPIIALGLGWWGKTYSSKELEYFKFGDKSKELLSRMSERYFLSCRDWESYHILKNANLRAKMTGCVAWYHLDYINKIHLNSSCSKSDRICISDPAAIKNYGLALELVDFLKKEYPSKRIQFIFHRGMGEEDQYTSQSVAKQQSELLEALKSKGVECLNIAFSHEGFTIYDGCFMHIGFRVHAHIYNLSIRQKSILIEEDSRGAGVNHSLGLAGIKAYNYVVPKKINHVYNIYMRKYNHNRYAIEELKYLLRELEMDDDLVYSMAFQRMKIYFDEMMDYILGINIK